ncbi:MAG: protein kinase [Candidatus Margulisiibacteriota bacterium]
MPKGRTAAIWVPRLAERMQNLRATLGLKVRQNQWKFAPPKPIPEEAFGPCFRANRQIAETDMSKVFKGWEVATQQPVVIKESSGSKYSFLFRREGEILYRLKHPHIVECLTYGDGFLVLESLEHTWLNELQLSHDEVLTLIFDVAEILRHCHQNHIVIRDFKDEHLLFSKEGVVKLIDLALARDLRAPRDIVEGHDIIGTSAFNAPEIMMEGSAMAGIAVDYYSLGVVLYVTLTGEIIQKRRIWAKDAEGKDRKTDVSYPQDGPIFSREWSLKVPELFHPILKGLLQRKPTRRLTDPDKLQRMVLEALITREGSPL